MDLLTNTMLKRIIQVNKPFIATEELMDFLSVSDRTVYNYWKKIETFLQDHHIEHFLSYDGKGFVFSRDDQQSQAIATLISQMNFYEYHLNADERSWVILVYLCTASAPITIKTLEDTLVMSRSTIINALRSVRERIQETGLVFEENTHYGFSLTAAEYERRELIFRAAEALHVIDDWHLKEHSFNPFVNLFTELFHMNRYEHNVQAAIHYLKKELDLQLSDHKYYRLQFALCILLDRIEDNHPVSISTGAEEAVPQRLLAGMLLQKLQIHVTPDIHETCYLACLLQKFHISNTDISHELNDAYIGMVVNHLLQCLEFHYKTMLTSDSMLTEYLCAHIAACYRRVKQLEHISNPLLTDIKQNYKTDFDILKDHIFILENSLNIALDDDEIAYILMHILAALERKKTDSYIPVLVVACNSGMATGNLLAALIRKHFQVRIAAICQMQNLEEMAELHHADLVITTIPTTFHKVDTLVLNAIPTKEDLLDLQNAITRLQDLHLNTSFLEQPVQEIQEYTDSVPLSDLLDEDSILLDSDAGTWKEAIIAAGELLLWKRCITVNYLNSMLDLIHQYGPYIVIAKGIALAHAAPKDGHLKAGFSMVRLKKPVSFGHTGNDPVSVVFSFTVPDKPAYTSTILNFMHAIRNPDFLTGILSSESPKEALRYILASCQNPGPKIE